MSNIDKIRQEIERRKKRWMLVDLPLAIGRYYEDRDILFFIDSLPEETSCIYDTNELTPTPSVNIEDVARVQFASHAHVFDRKRKAVFDWEQFKEVVGIFYGFGKKNSMPEETKDAEEAAARYERENRQSILSSVDIVNAFMDGAKWQKEQDEDWLNEELIKAHLNGVMTGDRIARESLPMPEDTVIFQKGVAEGRRLEREDNNKALAEMYGYEGGTESPLVKITFTIPKGQVKNLMPIKQGDVFGIENLTNKEGRR